jgi:hypothetical protein
VLGSTLGLRPDAQSATIGVSPNPIVGSLSISGLRLGDADVSIELNDDGEVIAASGADVLVG